MLCLKAIGWNGRGYAGGNGRFVAGARGRKYGCEPRRREGFRSCRRRQNICTDSTRNKRSKAGEASWNRGIARLLFQLHTHRIGGRNDVVVFGGFLWLVSTFSTTSLSSLIYLFLSTLSWPRLTCWWDVKSFYLRNQSCLNCQLIGYCLLMNLFLFIHFIEWIKSQIWFDSWRWWSTRTNWRPGNEVGSQRWASANRSTTIVGNSWGRQVLRVELFRWLFVN